jgi:hypothetical protein
MLAAATAYPGHIRDALHWLRVPLLAVSDLKARSAPAHRCTHREGGRCGGVIPAGGAGGSGGRTVAVPSSVSITTSGAAGAAAEAVSSAPLWRGCDPMAAETARARRAGRGNRRTGIAALTFAGVPRFALVDNLVAFRESATHAGSPARCQLACRGLHEIRQRRLYLPNGGLGWQ